MFFLSNKIKVNTSRQPRGSTSSRSSINESNGSSSSSLMASSSSAPASSSSSSTPLLHKANSRKRRPKTSFVWNYFDIDSKSRTKCRLCNIYLEFTSSTTCMRYHLLAVHQIKEKPFESTKTTPSSNGFDDNDSLSDSSSHEHDAISDKKSKSIQKAIVRFLIGTNQALSLVKHPLFKQMILECKPSAKIPSLYSINNHQIPNYFEETRKFVANELANCCRVTITCDGWQSKSNDSYLGSTGHAITNDWKYINLE